MNSKEKIEKDILKSSKNALKELEDRFVIKFDKSVNQWAGWVDGFPGIYAQCENKEDVKGELKEILKEFNKLK